jgi:hypothetical protein
VTEQDWFAPHSSADLYGEFSAIVQPRKLFLLGTAFLRRAWPLLPGEGVRLAVETTEAYAASRASARDLMESWTRAEEATGDGVWLDHAGGSRQWCRCPCCRFWADLDETGDGYPGVREAIRDPAWFAVRAAELAAELVGDAADRKGREEARQRERLEQWWAFHDIVGDPFAPARPSPVRLDHHPDLARLLAGFRRQSSLDALAMQALADALEEAGCADLALLGHCRSGAVHERTCWVIERLSGRELLHLPVEERQVRRCAPRR